MFHKSQGRYRFGTDNLSHVQENERGARARTRQAILSAAIEVLGQNPSAALSDIAAAADVGRTTLHRYFPERSDLLRAVAAEGSARLDAGHRERPPRRGHRRRGVASALPRILRPRRPALADLHRPVQRRHRRSSTAAATPASRPWSTAATATARSTPACRRPGCTACCGPSSTRAGATPGPERHLPARGPQAGGPHRRRSDRAARLRISSGTGRRGGPGWRRGWRRRWSPRRRSSCRPARRAAPSVVLSCGSVAVVDTLRRSAAQVSNVDSSFASAACCPALSFFCSASSTAVSCCTNAVVPFALAFRASAHTWVAFPPALAVGTGPSDRSGATVPARARPGSRWTDRRRCTRRGRSRRRRPPCRDLPRLPNNRRQRAPRRTRRQRRTGHAGASGDPPVGVAGPRPATLTRIHE